MLYSYVSIGGYWVFLFLARLVGFWRNYQNRIYCDLDLHWLLDVDNIRETRTDLSSTADRIVQICVSSVHCVCSYLVGLYSYCRMVMVL